MVGARGWLLAVDKETMRKAATWRKIAAAARASVGQLSPDAAGRKCTGTRVHVRHGRDNTDRHLIADCGGRKVSLVICSRV